MKVREYRGVVDFVNTVGGVLALEADLSDFECPPDQCGNMKQSQDDYNHL